MIWTLIHPKMTHEALGFLPGMLSESDPRPARELGLCERLHLGRFCS